MMPHLFYGYSRSEEKRFKEIRERVRQELEFEFQMMKVQEMI